MNRSTPHLQHTRHASDQAVRRLLLTDVVTELHVENGSFSLSAPAGRYEVVVAVPNYPVRWVTIKSGVHKVVRLPIIVCGG